MSSRNAPLWGGAFRDEISQGPKCTSQIWKCAVIGQSFVWSYPRSISHGHSRFFFRLLPALWLSRFHVSFHSIKYHFTFYYSPTSIIWTFRLSGFLHVSLVPRVFFMNINNMWSCYYILLYYLFIYSFIYYLLIIIHGVMKTGLANILQFFSTFPVW